MSDQWYFTSRGTQAGPAAWPDLQQLAIAGQVGASDLVWCEGMPEWVAASTVPGLFGAAAVPAPPTENPSSNDATTDSAEDEPPKGAPYIPQYAMADPYFVGQANSTIYAGFWLRFFAALVDGFLLLLIMVPILIGFMWLFAPDPITPASLGDTSTLGNATNPDTSPVLGLGLRLLIIAVGWLYFAYQESSSRQATLGKRALGLVVTDINGHRISFAKATGRHFGKIVSQITFLYGYIMAGTTERKQALHDVMANCLVVIKN